MKKIILNSKTKKQFFVLLMCVCISFNAAVINLNASAVDAYQFSPFKDVDVGVSYYDDLQLLLDLNIICGFPDGSFYPNKTVSKAEFIKMLVIAADYALVENAANTFEDIDGHWSAPYINTAIENKIIDIDLNSENTDFLPDEPITRQEMSMFMVNALHIYPYSVSMLYSDTDSEYINLASGEYLLLGYIENGQKIFKPHDSLIRADVCRVISRIVEYRKNAEEYKNKMILAFIKDNVITMERQLYDLLIACTTSYVDDITIQTTLFPYEVENAFNTFISMNPEKPSIRSINYEVYELDGIILSRLNFNYDLSKESEEYRLQEINKIADEFVKLYIRQDMTDAEKVTEIHKYLVLNCEYDENYRNVPDNIILDESTIDAFTAYGALVKKVAVCQGNAAAFNILAKKSGIASAAISGTPPNSSINHMWNMVCIDDTIYFIDTTWDQPFKDGSGYATKYLLKTEQEFSDLGYKWDATLAKKEYLNK